MYSRVYVCVRARACVRVPGRISVRFCDHGRIYNLSLGGRIAQ